MAAYKPIYTKEREWVNTGMPEGEIMVFHPTMEEFSNFSKYIEKIERSSAHLSSGVCKVIPPAGWHPRPSKDPSDYSDLEDFVIECPVKERMEGASSTGCYVKNNTVYRKQMRVGDFRRMAFSKQFRPPKPDYDLNELERHFWRNLLHHEPVYGADTPGSIYDADVREFNMNKLDTILDLLKEQRVTIKGVNTVFLYFGMWKTMFPWHAEDMDLYSINYLHFGEPKFWYAIPSQAAEKFERLAAQRFPDGLHICKAFLRHKVYVISPSVLRTHGIPFGTMVQYPGEFMITFPRGYHMGFNLGYNCAESTNFALERWIDYGKNAVVCYCRNDCVEIDMRPFMQKFRPKEYKEWFEYWYGERPAAYKIERRRSERTKRKSSKGSTDSSSEEGAAVPVVRCTKRQKAMFKARKPMRELWANQPLNLFAEKQHNIRCGKLYPHCSVCQYFVRREIWMRGTPVEELPERSKRFVSDQMFEKECRVEGVDWKMMEDTLLECANCKMVVHANCYPSRAGTLAQQQWQRSENQRGEDGEEGEQQNGIRRESFSDAVKAGCSFIQSEAKDQNEQHQSSSEWLCERCFNRSDIRIRSTSCSLCELRGGALLETHHRDPSGQGFVHVICALMDPGTRFLQPNERRSPLSSPARRWGATPQHYGDHDCFCSPARGSPSLSNMSLITPQPVIPSASCSNLLLCDSGIADSPANHHNNSSNIFHSQESCPDSSDPMLPPTLVPALTNKLLQRAMSCASMDSAASSTSVAQPPPPLLLPNSPVWSSASHGCLETFRPAASASPFRATGSDYGALTPDRASRLSASNLLSEYPACYQCEVCGQQSEHLVRCDICIEEQETAAKLRFHVTCAPLADVTFERREFPGALVVCDFHHSGRALEESASQLDERQFELKQRVVVDLSEEEPDEEKKEKLIGYGLIYAISEHLFATVDFLDGSSSSDIFPSDIFDCECKAFGCNGGQHIPGSMVYVSWNDDQPYLAYYRGQSPQKKYRIKLFPPLSFEVKDRRKREEQEAAAEPQSGGEEVKEAKERKREDEIELTSDMIFRRDEIHPEHVRKALLKRKSTEPNTPNKGMSTTGGS